MLLACLVLAGCGQVIGGRSTTPGAPAAEGDQLSPGIEVVDSIPGGLPASGAPRIDHGDVCGSIPAAALAELGYGAPHDRWDVFCQWLDKRDGHHFVNVASETLLVTTYTGLDTPAEDAVGQLCPKSRQVARAVLGHLGR
jgi:hypothetical protein